METKRSDGMTEAQLATLDKATDVVMADIERQEYGVTPEAGLQGIRTEALRRVIKGHLSQRHQMLAAQEKEIRALQEKVATVTDAARAAIRKAQAKAEAEAALEGFEANERLLAAVVARDHALREMAATQARCTAYAKEVTALTKRLRADKKSLLARVQAFMKSLTKGAK